MILTDKRITPYVIQVEENNFTLGTFSNPKDGKDPVFIPKGYFQKLGKAIERAIHLSFLKKNEKSILTLNEYILILDEKEKQIQAMLDEYTKSK